MSDATGQTPSTLREIAKTHRLLAELYAQLADESDVKAPKRRKQSLPDLGEVPPAAVVREVQATMRRRNR